MDGYFRDSRHSWNLRDSRYSLPWSGRGSSTPNGSNARDSRYSGSLNTRESRYSWEDIDPDRPPGIAPWNTPSAARLVPLQDLHPATLQSLEGPPAARPGSQSDTLQPPAGRPGPQRLSSSPATFNHEFEYQFQNWSQVSLHSLPDLPDSPRRGSGYAPLHPLRNVITPGEEEVSPPPPKKKQKDPSLVTFAGPKDPMNPKNWSNGKKWLTTLVVSSYAFISPVSSSAMAPALPQIASEFGIRSETEVILTLSVFVLAYAIGPLFLGPLSEVFGRVRVLQVSAFFYFSFNLACGFAQSEGQLIAFRFLAGLGGSAPLSIGGGVLGDIWPPAKRGRAVGIYQMAPLLGPAVGPVAGGFIAESVSWRWVFWSTSAASLLVQLIGMISLKETYAPTLLKRKAEGLRRSTGDMTLHTEFESDKTLPKVLRTATARPFRMLTTQPIIQVISIYMAYVFGMFYLLLSTFPSVYRGVYGESLGISGLHYLSLGIGFVIGAQINSYANFAIYRRLKQRNGDIGRPEFRIPQMFIASPLVPIGLFMYGWGVQYKVHWAIPDVGILIFGTGAVICLSCMQVYVIDTYTRYSASGIAAAIVLRSLAGFSFPLFAQKMYHALGYGWGNSVLGLAAIVAGIPAPIFFWYCGESLRKRSTFAAG